MEFYDDDFDDVKSTDDLHTYNSAPEFTDAQYKRMEQMAKWRASVGL